MNYQLKFLFISFFVFIFSIIGCLAIIEMNDYSDNVLGFIVANEPPKSIKTIFSSEVKTILVNTGERVKKEQLLAVLDNNSLLSKKQQIEHEILQNNKMVESTKSLKQLATQSVEITHQHIKRAQDAYHAQKELDKYELGIAQKNANLLPEGEAQKLSLKISDNIIDIAAFSGLSTLEKINVLAKAAEVISSVQKKQNSFQRLDYETRLKDAEYLVKQSNLYDQLNKKSQQNHEVEQKLSSLLIKQSSLHESRDKNNNELTLRRITSPVDGEVTYMSENLVNSSVVQNNEISFIISPHNTDFTIELYLPDDIYKEAKVGQYVNVEVFAWNHYKHGILVGKVESITNKKAPNIFNNQSTYIASVRLIDSSVSKFSLEHGFSVTASLMLGKTTILNYVLKKLNLDD